MPNFKKRVYNRTPSVRYRAAKVSAIIFFSNSNGEKLKNAPSLIVAILFINGNGVNPQGNEFIERIRLKK